MIPSARLRIAGSTISPDDIVVTPPAAVAVSTSLAQATSSSVGVERGGDHRHLAGMDRRTADEPHRLAAAGVGRQAVEVMNVGEHRHHRRWLTCGPRCDEQADACPVEDGTVGAPEIAGQVGLAEPH